VESRIRAGEVIDRIRTLVKKAPPQKDRVEINEAILEVPALIRTEIAKNAVSAKTQLADDLPPVWEIASSCSKLCSTSSSTLSKP
jgi:hypothetical protein